MEEGPTLDFKERQYRFNKASDRDKSELLKDVLAFTNTKRYRTAYILIGVKEVKGGRSEVVGVETHLDDANLHQFINSKTNRPVEFSYIPLRYDDKAIGVISIPLQSRPVYILKNCGKVNPNIVYVREGSSTGIASPEGIADMGRTQTPKLLEWFVRRLRNRATRAVSVTARKWHDNPRLRLGFDSPVRPENYAQARDMILRLTEHRLLDHSIFSKNLDSYDSLRWVFKLFEALADECNQVIRITGHSLIEFGALARVILEIEQNVNSEKKVWDEFRIGITNIHHPLPGPANYNILTLARQTVHFVQTIDNKEHYDNPENETFDPHDEPTFLRSPEWGEWH